MTSNRSMGAGAPRSRSVGLALLAVVVLVMAAGAIGLLATGGGTDELEPAVSPQQSQPTADPSATPEASEEPSAKKDEEKPGTKKGEPEQLGTGKTVQVKAVPTEEPVPLEETVELGPALDVDLAGLAGVEAKAQAPGEISGPALQVKVQVTNTSDKAVSLDSVIVFVSYGADRAPASEFGSSADPLRGRLAPGATRTGTYLYAVPVEARDDVRVEVSHQGSPTVAFTGSAGD